MKNDLEELYGEWLVEQNLLQAELFLEQTQILEEIASSNSSETPDWSTWCKTLCS